MGMTSKTKLRRLAFKMMEIHPEVDGWKFGNLLGHYCYMKKDRLIFFALELNTPKTIDIQVMTAKNCFLAHEGVPYEGPLNVEKVLTALKPWMENAMGLGR